MYWNQDPWENLLCQTLWNPFKWSVEGSVIRIRGAGDLSPPPNSHIERGPVSCGGSSGLQWVSGMVSEISWLSGQKQALVLAYPITGSPFSLIFGVLQVTYLHVNSVTHLKRYNFILFNITLLLIFLFHIWYSAGIDWLNEREIIYVSRS